MGDFLYSLGNMIQSQFGLSDSKNKSLDISVDGQTQRYGQLGDFANKFDRSAERRYLEEGYTSNTRIPKVFQILSQEPDCTIVIKKRDFHSLSNHNQYEYLSKDDLNYLKATSILFDNKCKQIAMYERLSKIERIAQMAGAIDFGLLPILIDTYDAASNIFGIDKPGDPNANSGGLFSQKFSSAVDKVRKLTAYNKPSLLTTWTTDPLRISKSTFGSGTGVIELTTVASFHTTTSINGLGQGNASFTMEDPYRICKITEQDIERAIADAFNPYYNSSFYQFTSTSLQGMIQKNQRILNDKRQFRNVNKINFIVDPGAFLSSKVRVIIDGIGYEVKYDQNTDLSVDSIFSNGVQMVIDASAKYKSDALGNQGLKDDEIALVQSIVTSIFSSLSLQQNTKTKIKKFNSETNYVRRKMDLAYHGKNIVQPMDSIHIYIMSKTRNDAKILGGLNTNLSSLNFMENVNKQLGDITDQFNTLFNPSSSFSAVEKSVFVGDNFPGWMWAGLRNQFVNDKAGTHVFAGLVSSAEGLYNDGKFTLSVTCKDNAQYFQLGQVNFNPSIAQVFSPLYDPVTPFKLSFDTTTGKLNGVPELLDENKKFLSQGNPKYSSGPLAGQVATETNYPHQDSVRFNNKLQQIIYQPDGFQYRWKEGIGSLVKSQDSYDAKFANIPRPSIPQVSHEEVFGGQDTMNVLSLLITGEPYNYATFFKNVTIQADFKGAVQNDPSFFRNLLTDLQKNNTLWGKFIPFKKMIVNDEAINNVINGLASAQQYTSQMDNLLSQRAKLFDDLSHESPLGLQTSTNSANNYVTATYGSSIANETAAKLAEIDNQIDVLNSNINIASGNKILNGPVLGENGTDVSFDTDAFLNTNNGSDVLLNPKLRKQMRRKINFLTRRMFYNVKANQDKNYFIVDDAYDKDLDIQAFSEQLRTTDLSLFNDNYQNTAQLITTTSSVLDLEVFADSQGHIQARVPQYNRIPSSVLLRLIRKSDESGVQIFPQYLRDLFTNQIEGFLKNIEIIEDQIRLIAAALSMTTDSDIVRQIITPDDAGGTAGFNFISDEATGTISEIHTLVADSSNPGVQRSLLSSQIINPTDGFSAVTHLNRELTDQATKVVFAADIRTQSLFIKNNFTKDFTQTHKTGISPFDTNNSVIKSRVDTVSQHLSEKTGVYPDSLDKLFNFKSYVAQGQVSLQDTLNIVKQIGQLVSTRQRLVKQAYAALNTVQTSLQAATDADKGTLLFPNLYQNGDVPDVIEHMVEDESYDDYGPGSGNRYIIQNHHIISAQFSESPPDFNHVQVSGVAYNAGGLVAGPEDFGVGNDGNFVSTAWAVDYDMWRMYGLFISKSVQMPCLSDPELQLAPFAVALLNRARRNVLKGSVSLVGNEYIQPGEVYYIEPENMLYYAESVTHTFTYGQQFSTTVSFSYGHSPGQYIPTSFDAIGKVLYRNKDNSNVVTIRSDDVFTQRKLGAFAIPDVITIANDASDILNQDNPFGQSARTLFSNILNSTASLLGSSITPPPTARLELRVFYDSSGSGQDAHFDRIKSFANKLEALFQTNVAIEPQDPSGKTVSSTRPTLNNVFVQPVDMSDHKDFRTPTQQAWSLARAMTNQKGTTFASGLPEKAVMMSSIIDVVLVMDPTVTKDSG